MELAQGVVRGSGGLLPAGRPRKPPDLRPQAVFDSRAAPCQQRTADHREGSPLLLLADQAEVAHYIEDPPVMLREPLAWSSAILNISPRPEGLEPRGASGW